MPPPVRAVPVSGSPPAAEPAQLVENFFHHETGRLHGALIRTFGIENLALIEDATQEAMLRALRLWTQGGIPPNPSAWISRVAQNLARDALRHRRMSESKTAAIVAHFDQLRPGGETPDPADQEIRDDALRLMFVCCHPAIAGDAQVVLTLKVLCGFTTAEIARAFLASDAAIEKQLTRTKQRIHDAGIRFELPAGGDLAPRLEGVLATLYLLFGEGYKASAGDRLLREELCAEALRLASLLVTYPQLALPRTHALLAFLLLTAARLPARVDADGMLLRLDDQDRAQWDQALIARGLRELGAAATGTEISEYHLHAGIAACHATAASYASTDWARIRRLYEELYRLKPSPVVALNRVVAIAQLEGPASGLAALATIPDRARLDDYYLLPAVEGEFRWQLGQRDDALRCFHRAQALARVEPERRHLARQIERLQSVARPA